VASSSSAQQTVPSWSDAYRIVVESVDDYAIFVIDLDGRVASWNAGAERIKGYEAAEIVGRHFSMFYRREDVDDGKPARELKLAAETGRVEDEGWRVRKDGTLFWANVAITALRDANGSLQGFAKLTRDLTWRRTAEEQLHRSEQRFHYLVDAVTDYAIFMLDPTGHVETWNVGARRTKGYEPAEIIGQHFSVFYTPEDRAAGRPELILEAVRRDGRYEDEGWRVRKDGSRFWANVVVTALRDDTGELIGFAKITRDLTERRAAEETARELIREQTARTTAEESSGLLREERERYRALSRRLEVILEGVGDGIIVQDRSGSLIFANTAAAKVCGFPTADALLHAPTAELFVRFDIADEQGVAFHPSDLPGRKVLAGASAAAALLRVTDRETGQQTWTQVRASAVMGVDDRPELAVNIWHDVTEDRRREEREIYLARATTALSSSLEYEPMLATLAALLVPGLADWCSIHLVDGDDLEPVAVAHADPERVALAREYHEKYPPRPGQSHGLSNVVRTGNPELYSEISPELLARGARDPEHLTLLRSVGMKSLMVVPIGVRGRVTGTISLVSAEGGRRYDAQDLTLAEELGRRAGTCIENARLYAAEKRARSHLELVARAGEALSRTLDYEETLRTVVGMSLPALGDFAFLDVVQGDEVRRLAAAHDDEEVDALVKQTTWVRSGRTDKNLCALESGETGLHPDIDDAWMQDVAINPEHLALLRRLQLSSMVTVPLRAHGELLGSLTLCFAKSGRHHTEDDARLAEELARRGSVAVIQARLYERAQAAATRAEEASRVKDEFLATVSHELRTPLNAILGWASLIRDQSANASALAKGIDVIHRNAQAQAKIVDDILDVSRIITGKLRLELARADLVTIIHDAIEVVRPSTAAKGIAIELAPASADAVVVADPERLRQVVWNLLSNAVKFTDAGGRVTIDVAREGSNVLVSVTDTGRGIDPGFLPHVFDPFKQADGSTTRRVGGLGLGLASVRHIVELHGGDVRVHSAGIGTGATFTISLPVRAVAPALYPLQHPSSASAPIESTPRSLDGLRVVVVDDEPDARELLVVVLERAGATVSTAASAKEGFELLKELRPHVLVSDIGMPGEDGYGFMRRVRTLDPAMGGGIPSVALTAYTRAEDKTRALTEGFTTHIGKPVNADELLAVVANLARFGPRPDE
jgi:PAS domain S-box-containing protein